MNKLLEEIAQLYTVKSHKELSRRLLSNSKEVLSNMLIDLLTIYFNDKNSSTLRQHILVTFAGFIPSTKKIGYNGYSKQSIDGIKPRYCEAKPSNINTNDEKIKKLSGAGNFTDYTFRRLNRDKKKNPLMIVGGFIDGRLIYIFRFPFNSRAFTDCLTKKLSNRFPQGEDVNGQYLRSAGFSLIDYRDIEDLELELFVSKKELDNYKAYITSTLYSVLAKK